MTTKTESELRTLDAWLAVNLFGFARTRIPYHPSDNRVIDGAIYSPNGVHFDCGQSSCVPWYHSDPAAAMQVLEKCLTKTPVEIISPSDNWFRVSAVTGFNRITAEYGETLPIAIARFAKQLFDGQAEHRQIGDTSYPVGPRGL